MPDKEREEEGEERERERAGEGGRETGVQVKGEEGAVRGKAGKIKERCVTFWCFSRCRRTMDSDDGSDVVWSAEGREGPPPSAGEESEGGEEKEEEGGGRAEEEGALKWRPLVDLRLARGRIPAARVSRALGVSEAEWASLESPPGGERGTEEAEEGRAPWSRLGGGRPCT